jgi:hypothetical protein
MEQVVSKWSVANHYVDHCSEAEIDNSRIKRAAELQAYKFRGKEEDDNTPSI